MSDDKSLVALRDRREQVIALLSDAFARDLVDMDEFERRLGLAHRAEALVELAPLVQDLEAAPSARGQAALVPMPSHGAVVSRVRDKQLIVAIMAGVQRKGSWTPARKMRVFAVMGGAELDFREASFGPGITEVHIFALMGGAQIIVPPTLAVEMDGVAIMGGFDQADRAPVHDLDPDRPLLRVTGFAMMGGVQIETRLAGESSWQASRRKRKERKELRKRAKLDGKLDGKEQKLLREPRDD